MPNRTAWSLTFLIALARALRRRQRQPDSRWRLSGPIPLMIVLSASRSAPVAGLTPGVTRWLLLMQRAYGVVDWNVSSGPGWIRTDRYDVAAKADVAGNLTEAQVKPMLQALLAERFKLRLHQSSKEMSGYALVVGKGGPKVKAAADGEETLTRFE